MMQKLKISLVLADVDGTLVNEDKVLTTRALAAVQHLREAGILTPTVAAVLKSASAMVVRI